MPAIKIELKDAPPPQSLGTLIDLHVSYPAPNLIPPGKGSGPYWCLSLDPGAYLFVCAVGGSPGPCGPVTVTDIDTGNVLASVSGNISAESDDFGMGSIPVHFIVA